jgi:hypothetical protein
MNSLNNQAKVSRTSFLKDPVDALEIMIPSSKDKRKASSASKLRSKITHHSPSAPFQKEKSSSIIQKHIERIIHSTFSSEKRNSEGNIHKSKRPSSGKQRKGVTFRSGKKKILEIQENLTCSECKKPTFLDFSCKECKNSSKTLNFSMEIKPIPHNSEKIQVTIGKQDFLVNFSETLEISVKIPNDFKEIHEKIKNFEPDVRNGWSADMLMVTTPSFQGTSEKLIENHLKTGNFLNDFEVSFAENGKNFEFLNSKVEELDKILTGFKQDLGKESKVSEFSEKLMQVFDGISEVSNDGVKELMERMKKIMKVYFKCFVNRSQVSLLHKKLDLRFAGIGNTSTGVSLSTSKF